MPTPSLERMFEELNYMLYSPQALKKRLSSTLKLAGYSESLTNMIAYSKGWSKELKVLRSGFYIVKEDRGFIIRVHSVESTVDLATALLTSYQKILKQNHILCSRFEDHIRVPFIQKDE